MHERYKEILQILNESYENGEDYFPVSLKHNSKEDAETRHILEYLHKMGYISIDSKRLDSYKVRITPIGNTFVKNGFEPIINNSSNTVNVNDNATYIGNANDISNFNNTINNETTNNTIPEEYTKLMEELLKDINDNKIPKEKISSKVIDFLSKVLGSTASSMGIKLISNFIMVLIKK